MSKFIYGLKAIKRNLKKFLKSSFFRAKFIYTRYYEKLPINNELILIQSYSGTSITGNPYYFLKELCINPKYATFKKIVSSNKINYEEIVSFIKEHSLTNVKVVKMHTREYCKILASAKYLITNVTFPFYFIKKEEQVYLNTWHGTPLKALGKRMTEDMHTIGNVQRNFLMSDYILAPNQFTLDVLRNDYMLNQLYKGKYILNGYPRNYAFYDIENQKLIREKLELENKKIYVYMPTWRGSHALRKNNEQFYYIMHMLIEIDKNLDDNSILYVKEHNMSSLKIDFSQFEHIQQFPNNYETYEFLSIADCLITDYSSVMFDFSNTGRKIILYAYDEKEYLKDRGMYIDFHSLPFEIVDTSKALVNSIISVDTYSCYKNNIESYIKYDSIDNVPYILDLMINNHSNDKLNIISGSEYANNNENVLIFTGSLLKNGITTALKGILNNIDSNKRNYILTFSKTAVAKNKHTINELGNYDYISVQGQRNMLISEAFYSFLYYRLNLNNNFINEKINNIYRREVKRIYPGINFDYIIHYTGYERHFMNIFRVMNGIRMVYVHNNLIKENKVRKNIHLPTIKSCYKEFDKIVIIRESMKQELLSEDIDGIKNKIILAHNLNNYDLIIKNSKKEIEFDDDTVCNFSLEELNCILNKKDSSKFINIARFSVEKGLDNLISAFEKYFLKNHNDYLIIIGGHGKTYNDIIEQVEKSPAKDHIVIIKSISNPFPILNKSDVFILSSHYEGLPMVIMEALILSKPVISTSITGPKEFLEQGYGYLVPDSVEGLLEGFIKFDTTKLTNLKPFDYLKFNEMALKQFNDLFR